MRELVDRYLDNRLSRREFGQALAALGMSAAGVAAALRAVEAAGNGTPGTSRTVTGTGGELMVEQMKAAGVKFLFTNPGSYEVGFFDAFLDQPVQLVLGLHEGLVIAMADGYHKVSGEPAFINVHVIAGTAQAAGQLYNASRDGSALVVTAGLLSNEMDDDDVLLAPRPGFDQKEVCRQFTKISWESHDPAGLPAMLRRAFKVSMTPPGGPVYLAVPNYVLEKKDVTAEIFDKASFMLPDAIPPNAADIEKLAQWLIESKSPILLLGDEVVKAGAQAEAFELAELLRIPVGEGTLRPFHVFPHHHTLFQGGMNMRGKDLVLQVGVTDMGGGPIPNPQAATTGTKVAVIGLNTNAVGATHPFDLAIVANVKLALRALIDALKATATSERIAQITQDRTAPGKKKPEVNPANLGKSPMHPDELGWALEEMLDPDAIVVSENLSGSNQFLNTGFRDDEKMWLANSGAGLGWGIGAATGAKIAAPDRQVVCNIGDGSVMYSAAGFWTQARYHVPVLTVVCNNRNYQTVRTAYARYNGKMRATNRYVGMHLGDPDIDFAKLAQSQGVDGENVQTPDELRAALKRGIEATRAGEPFVVNALVSCTGAGADSTWHQAYSVADQRTRKV